MEPGTRILLLPAFPGVCEGDYPLPLGQPVPQLDPTAWPVQLEGGLCR